MWQFYKCHYVGTLQRANATTHKQPANADMLRVTPLLSIMLDDKVKFCQMIDMSTME